MQHLMPWAASIATETYAAFYAALASMTEPWPAWLLAVSLKGAALLAAAGIAGALLRGAAMRHLVWSFALGCLLLVPALAAVLPTLDLPAPPATRPAPASAEEPYLEGDAAAEPTAVPAVRGLAARPVAVRLAVHPATSEPGAAPVTSVMSVPRPADPAAHRASPAVSRGTLAVAAWVGGFLLFLGSFAFSIRERRRLATGAKPVSDGSWLALLDQLRGRLRVRHEVRLQTSAQAVVPMTWGFRRPVILLPEGAERWPAERRRDVLLHELAHVQRGDALTQAAARMICAAYWFHPLVWWAARRLRIESEHACDDRVLAAGSPAPDYAGHLLAAARSLRCAVPAAAVAMARPSRLESRIRGILDEGRDRSPLTAGRLLTTWLLAGCLVLPLAAAAPRTAPEAPPAPEATAAPEAVPAPEAMPTEEAVPDAPAPPAVPAPEAAPAPSAPSLTAGGRSVEAFAGPVPSYSERCGDGELSESIHGRNGDYDIEIEVGRCRFDIEMRGDIEFNADESGVERMGRQAYLEIDEQVGRDRRKIEITPGPDGRPEYTWFVDRRRRPFDDDAKRWLKEALPMVFRATGIDAHARVGRILARSDVDGVLAEVPLLLGDHFQWIYLEELMQQADLTPAELERMLRLAGREIGSDHNLGELLVGIFQVQLAERGPRMAYVEASRSIGSDHELRRTLRALLDQDLSEEVLSAVLESAQTIGSDHEMAELLSEFVRKELPPDGSFFTALATVGSDHEHGKVLTAVMRQAEMTPELARSVLESSLTIGSDYEQAQILVLLGSLATIGEELRPLFRQALDSVGSKYERERVLESMWY